MPYSKAAADQPAQTMWQLSIAMPEAEAHHLAASGGDAVLTELKRRCETWHAPVPAMLAGTQPEALWVAPLCDAPPPPPPKKGSKSAITVLGDAAHPM
eukprot:SAG11_NODE_25204_length_362_cov_0.783270_2_plen_98_part_01